jgi:hypothetical protein
MMMMEKNWNMPLVNAARATWPDERWQHWHKYNDGNAIKLATKDPSRVTTPVAELIRQMATLQVEDGWFPDLDLHGAGMHWIQQGGYLGRHLDGQIHPLTGWYRRCNAIVFLDHCEGGELVIDGQEPIVPEPGRLICFNADQWHEVRPVISGQRRSVSLFWWSVDGTGTRDRAFFQG